MKAEALQTINTCLNTIEGISTRMYYNDESPSVVSGLIRQAVKDARKALYTARVEEMVDNYPPVREEYEDACRIEGLTPSEVF